MPVFRLGPEPIFPPVDLAEPEGLLALGGDLKTERLLTAYRQGIFPWYEPGGPILWWSPDPGSSWFPPSSVSQRDCGAPSARAASRRVTTPRLPRSSKHAPRSRGDTRKEPGSHPRSSKPISGSTSLVTPIA